MKKTILIIFIIQLLSLGCSKKNNKINEVKVWKTWEASVFQNKIKSKDNKMLMIFKEDKKLIFKYGFEFLNP
ncbi:MAG: hypothetical protein KAR07_03835, partial [Spirochaetes bacterium]|nr:hypothetical protein [Spirochaetota bacterium]